VGKGHLKLSTGEALHLARLLREIGRPASPDQQRDMWAWVKRLEGEDG